MCVIIEVDIIPIFFVMHPLCTFRRNCDTIYLHITVAIIVIFQLNVQNQLFNSGLRRTKPMGLKPGSGIRDDCV